MYIPVKLNDRTWLVVVALDNTSMAVDNRGASSAMLEDNKAAIFVSLDKKNKDYYACDAGCLDPPVKLGPDISQFPVVFYILYIARNSLW